MHHEFSLAYLSAFGIAPPDMITIAWRAGFDYVGLRLNPVTTSEPVFPLATDRRLMLETRQRLNDTGMRVLDVELFRLTEAFDAAECGALLDASVELNAKHVIAQAADTDTTRASDHLGQLCDAALSRGLTVDLEFVTWTQTPDMKRAADIIQRTGHPGAGLLIDTLHFSRSHCSVAELAALPREWFRYAQVCDAPARAPDSVDGLIHAARNDRLFPGEGDLDLSGILGALPTEIPYSLEIPRTALARVIGIDECVRLALASARKFVYELRRPLTHLPPVQRPTLQRRSH